MSENPWSRFRTCWELLNATPEEIQGCGRTDPESGPRGWRRQEIADLVELLEAFRTLYQMTARDCLEDKTWGGMDRRVWEIMAKYELLPRPSFRKTGQRVELIEWQNLTPYFAPVHEATHATSPFGMVSHRIAELVETLIGASASSIYVCEECGRIGPAQQSNKRFCGNACRSRARRRKVGTKI